jgi:ATP-dependent protease Clp ATPase subunit
MANNSNTDYELTQDELEFEQLEAEHFAREERRFVGMIMDDNGDNEDNGIVHEISDETSEEEEEEIANEVIHYRQEVTDKQRFIMFAATMNRNGALNTDAVSVVGFYMRNTVRICFKFQSFANMITKQFLDSIEADEVDIKKTKSSQLHTARMTLEASVGFRSLREMVDTLKFVREIVIDEGYPFESQEKIEYYQIKRSLTFEEI